MALAETQAAALPTVLVVDDEPELLSLLAEYLSRFGFIVQTADGAAAARMRVAQAPPRVAILDINMPGENGLSLARWLREAHPATAIVMLTTSNEAIDRVVGLELGADDYLGKPFELRELLARVRAVLRRSQPAAVAMGGPSASSRPHTETPQTESSERVRFGAHVLDMSQRKLMNDQGQEVELTAAEFDLMLLFARHPNRPLTRDQIMAQAHNRGWDVFDRSIDLRVMRLRRKIERNPDKPELLKTVRNVGYVFVPAAWS
jgi:two-component system phosphate regulon response regulator OmpR